MIDHSYVELTSACVQGLALFSRTHPGVRAEEICRAIARGRDFLLREQRGDGSFAGSWAICFTYGTWFGIWGLRESGLPADHPAIQSAADFLTMHQLSDGGWGETIESCRTGRYCSTPSGQAVMTSWALLALARAGRAGTDAHARGQKFLRARQLADGTWPPEHIAGVFNKTCAIHYDAYLKLFPLWALT
jgi:squalene cyclase